MYEQAIRVYYEDTDAGGVVYHANYLKFMERCRSDWLDSLGYDVKTVEQSFNVIFAVRKAEIDFIAPAKLCDDLRVTCEILQLGKVKLSFKQNIYNNEQLLCSAVIKLATLSSNSFTLIPIPAEIISALTN